MISLEEACKIAKKEIGELLPNALDIGDCWVFFRSSVKEFPIGNIPLAVEKKTGKVSGVGHTTPLFKKLSTGTDLKLPANY